MGPFTSIILGFGLQVVGYLMQARQAAKNTKKPRKSQFKEPVAEPGRTMAIIAGTVIVSDPQILFTGERTITDRKVSIKEK